MNPRVKTATVGGRTKWLRAAGLTHPGKVRGANEDAFCLAKVPAQGGLLVAVADGMGGHGGGELAAAIALETLTAPPAVPWAEGGPDALHERLLDRFYAADDAIRERGRQELGRGAMGTTLVAALLRADGLLHLYAGDSRLYHFGGGQLLYRTRDHNAAQVLVDMGMPVPEGRAGAALRSQLTSCLGGSASGSRFVADPRAGEGEGSPPSWRPTQPGDVLLLVSDGVTNELDDTRLTALARAHGAEPARLVRAVRDAVLEGVAADNVTAVAVRWGARDTGRKAE